MKHSAAHQNCHLVASNGSPTRELLREVTMVVVAELARLCFYLNSKSTNPIFVDLACSQENKTPKRARFSVNTTAELLQVQYLRYRKWLLEVVADIKCPPREGNES